MHNRDGNTTNNEKELKKYNELYRISRFNCHQTIERDIFDIVD